MSTTRTTTVADTLPSDAATQQLEGIQTTPSVPVASDARRNAQSKSNVVKAPIGGRILDLKVTEGNTVCVGQTVFTMKAMKLKHQICSTVAGKVKEIKFEKGATVAAHDVIVVIG